MKKIITLGLVAAIGLVAQSCKKDDASQASNPGTMGTMKIKMTDAPADYSQLNIQISSVEAYSVEDESWIMLNSQSQMVSVLDLTNGTETILASTSVEAGVYSKLRITFGTSNSLTLNENSGGNTLNLAFASSADHQVEIEIDQQVNSNSTAEVLVDFNVANSIIGIGNNYFLNPIIECIEDAATGVRGDVDGAAFAHILLWNNQDTVSTYTNFQGKFLIRGIEEGTYSIEVQAYSNQPGQLNTETVTGISVSSGDITNVGTIEMN